MDEIAARTQAKTIATLAFEVVRRGIDPSKFDHVLTIANVLQMGAVILRSARHMLTPDLAKVAINEEFLSSLMGTLHDPSQFEEFVYKRLIGLQEDPVTLERQIEEARAFISNPHKARKLVLEAVNEMVPPGAQGRGKKITQTQFAAFVQMIEALKPACTAFVSLRYEFPRKDALSILEFIESQFSEAVYLMRKHHNTLDQFSGSQGPIAALKRQETRAQRLAEAIAGAEWQLTPSYSRQKASEARRFLKKQSGK